MKTSKIVSRTILGAVTFGLALATWLPVRGQDQTPMKPMKGGEHLMMLNHINTPTQANNLNTNDAVVMVCPKCKTVFVERVTTEKGHIQVMTPGTEHLCSGCNGTIKVIGVGKGAKTVLKHVCSKCGGSAFCCATSTNSAPTTGMETK